MSCLSLLLSNYFSWLLAYVDGNCCMLDSCGTMPKSIACLSGWACHLLLHLWCDCHRSIGQPSLVCQRFVTGTLRAWSYGCLAKVLSQMAASANAPSDMSDFVWNPADGHAFHLAFSLFVALDSGFALDPAWAPLSDLVAEVRSFAVVAHSRKWHCTCSIV